MVKKEAGAIIVALLLVVTLGAGVANASGVTTNKSATIIAPASFFTILYTSFMLIHRTIGYIKLSG